MSFLKCKKCDHIDTLPRFTTRAGRRNLPPVCPRCFNDEHNIVELGDEVSCAGCIYHTLIAGSCSNPKNRPGSDFWNRPQTACYTSSLTRIPTSHPHYLNLSAEPEHG